MSSEVSFTARYNKLNAAQREAVDAIEGPVLVVAGPGSGKTELLSVRAANILEKTDAYASDILCLTFTDAAEVNMRKRLTEIIKGEANYIKVNTFHNFCKRIRELHPEHFEITTDFSVADDIVRTEILEDIFAYMSHDNPLSSVHPEKGYTFMRPVMSAIGDLKSAGLNPDEFSDVLAANQEFIKSVRTDVNEVFSMTSSKKIFPDIERLIDVFEDNQVESPVPHFRSLAYALAARLTRALEEAKAEESTKPITAFKKEHTKKSGNDRILKADRDLEKMQALADVYQQYEKAMYNAGFYDFDDMILEVIHELEDNDDLRAEIAENNQYIMVDEFQDTNDAQLRLVMALTKEAPSAPNIMVVGDDDQAIYRFQGAEVSNILHFKHTFADTKVVTLTKNYRSGQKILNAAQSVIKQGTERLESVITEVEKDLEAAGEIAEDISVTRHPHKTKTHQNHAVAMRVKQLIDDGIAPEEIAILGRKHRDLEALVPYLHESEIPITYERQQDVLQEPHVRQLIATCRLVNHIRAGEHEEAEGKLSEVLSFPFWGLERKAVWELSVKAKDSDKSWFAIAEEEGGRLKEIVDFLINTAEDAAYEPVEYVLEKLVGADEIAGADSEMADAEPESREDDDEFVSPFKSYFFSKEARRDDPSKYLRFLSSLKAFVFSLREHKESKTLLLEDLVHFVDTHEDNNLLVTDTSPFVNAQNAVTLMTAHKAKGQEFEAVIITSAVNDMWANKRSGGKISFPENLPIQFSGNTADDQLRLLFVAMTRAKHTLDLFSYDVDDAGSEQVPLSFLEPAEIEAHDDAADLPSTDTLLASTVPVYHGGPYVPDEEALLRPLVEDYRLSVTHLNNFLDVRYGGPENFLTSNLLRFPQPMSASQVYGSAIHGVLERAAIVLKKTGQTPNVSQLTEWFEDYIERSRLSSRDKAHYSERGADALTHFWQEKEGLFAPDDYVEYNFRSEHVVVDEVPLSGKIDLMKKGEGKMQVFDYKTGSAFTSFRPSLQKSQNYRRQLIFYKLLVENAADFNDLRVDVGTLLFVEPKDEEIISLNYEITEEDVDELRQLIQVVHDHIVNLNFPDTSHYSEDYKGVRAFREDLLNGNL